MMQGEGTKALCSPYYVNLSEYPPGTDIEYELHWDGHRIVGKVPRWAHNKWLRKYQNAGGKRPCEDHPNSADASASGTKALKCPRVDLVEIPSETAAAVYGGKHPCVDHPSSALADDAAAASGSKAFKCACEDLVEIPSETAAGYEAFKCPCKELDEIPSETAYEDLVEIPSETAAAYAEVIDSHPPEVACVFPNAYVYHCYPDRYDHVVEGGRVVLKLNKFAGLGSLSRWRVENQSKLPSLLQQQQPAANS